jgi:peptide/nickel transport system substrate-binding protein
MIDSLRRRLASLCSIALLLLATPFCLVAIAEPMHGIAMHGDPAYGPDFTHFSYASPDAPRGGDVRLAVTGSFDSTNPLIVRGASAAGIRSHVYESLMARALDEPFSLYGLIAETIETPDDRSWVAFSLRPEAHFSDGTPITVDDVIFSLETLRDHGRPNHRSYYSKVVEIQRPDARTVKFIFGPEIDREMPLILGLMPIIPQHYYEDREFETATLDAPLGSGPYVVESVDVGAQIVYRRDPNHWARDLAPNRGRHNFDRLIYDYYRDTTSSFEAFKKGLYDMRTEGDPTRWATSYDFDAIEDGRVVSEQFETGLPSGMSAFVFNTRRPVFSDIRVRRAFIYMFDFEWINHSLFYDLYDRTQSFYDNSELSSLGRPADERELELLAPFPNAVTQEVLDGTYVMPVSDGSGRNRENWRIATALLEEAGYEVRDGAMVDAESGEALTFELLVGTREQERLALHFSRTLERIGVTINVRQIDSSQMQQRRQTYDFDMIPYKWFASLSPGNEQSFYWGTSGRENEGTRNYMGADEPAIDAMIAGLLAARERPEFVSAVRALDRVLMSGNYVIPLFHTTTKWTARWTHLQHPDATSLYGHQLDTWWYVENQ